MRVTSQSVELSWTNERTVTEFVVTYVPTGLGEPQRDMRVSAEQTSVTIVELTPGVEYLIGVSAVLNNETSVPATATLTTTGKSTFILQKCSAVAELKKRRHFELDPT